MVRFYRIATGDYTVEDVARFLLHATSTGRSMPPDRNLAAAKRALVKAHRESLFTELGPLPADEDSTFLAAYHIQQTLRAKGRACSDHTAIVKLAGGRKGFCDTLLKRLKARRQTLEQIAAAHPLASLFGGKHQPKI
jgi:hypothetical protein